MGCIGGPKLILIFLSVEVYASIAFAFGRTELIWVVHSVEIYISDTFAYGRSKLIMGFHTAEVAKKEKKVLNIHQEKQVQTAV